MDFYVGQRSHRPVSGGIGVAIGLWRPPPVRVELRVPDCGGGSVMENIGHRHRQLRAPIRDVGGHVTSRLLDPGLGSVFSPRLASCRSRRMQSLHRGRGVRELTGGANWCLLDPGLGSDDTSSVTGPAGRLPPSLDTGVVLNNTSKFEFEHLASEINTLRGHAR